MGNLTSAQVNKVARGSEPGPAKLFDGEGLFLKITAARTASWVFRFERNGTRREIGLGSLSAIGLSDAREIASEHRRTVAMGGDPVSTRQAATQAAADAMTFDDAVTEFIAAHEPSWKNPKHRQQWRNTLTTYASPVIGALALPAITADHVAKIITPLWSSKPETASRLRGRLERVLDWAKARGLRDGENPARWRGHFALMLPPKRTVHRVEHHAAVPVADMPAVYAGLCDSEGTAALALRFNILCAGRPGETTGATWSEIDMAAKVWTIPRERMKRDREHRVPLSDEAIAVLKQAEARQRSEYVFPGGKRTRGKETSLSLASLSKALRQAGGGEATPHGTSRSSFDDWATERGYTPALIDRALAHVEKSATVAAYRRTDLLEQRRPMMTAWAAYLTERDHG
ncbi:tyrosine-type recombinase/integrase [Reyranella aquatilis]|uniref:Tyrosine-type recombinase/integrase n=1 Tax=Reyranella aquatilis TaxID=2035356 RepID=A0ABS8L1A1_9HYPH|nr:integrase arm-type DNA-binding domain-containing protein [Reyranella aquatilis]MCC8432115.1 tyrosine-type recombinase/integrase [Reyranella aquatilis]